MSETERPEQIAVPLNMEETGVLCHLMMANDEFRKAVLHETVCEDPSLARWFALYIKLAKANNILMGKPEE